MRKKQEDFLQLLRIGLWGDYDVAKRLKDVDWDVTYALAKEQCVVGVIADAFPYLSAGQLDDDEKLRWLGTVIQIQRKNVEMNSLVGALCDKFKEMQLHPVVLKGQVFATAYPHPMYRQSGDIDIYFKERDECRQAVNWACTMCKEAATAEENKRERKHFSFSVNGQIVELHYFMSLFENGQLQRRLQEIIYEGLKNEEPFLVDINGKQIEGVPPTLSVLHQVLHISRHLLEAGIGLRQICDLAMFLDKYEEKVDREKLCRWLDELQLMILAKALGYILVNNLGLKAEKLPFGLDGQYADFVLREIFEGGNFGKKKVKYRKKNHRVLRKMKSIGYFYQRCKTYQPLMPDEAKSYFWNKIKLNIKLMFVHHY